MHVHHVNLTQALSPAVIAAAIMAETVHASASEADVVAAQELFNALNAWLDKADVRRQTVMLALHTTIVAMAAESLGLDPYRFDSMELLRRALETMVAAAAEEKLS
jgi:succinylglutamate desuccinylase